MGTLRDRMLEGMRLAGFRVRMTKARWALGSRRTGVPEPALSRMSLGASAPT